MGKTRYSGGEEMAQLLRALDCSWEDPDLVPRIHVRNLIIAVTPILGDLMPYSGSKGTALKYM